MALEEMMCLLGCPAVNVPRGCVALPLVLSGTGSGVVCRHFLDAFLCQPQTVNRLLYIRSLVNISVVHNHPTDWPAMCKCLRGLEAML